MAETSTGEQRQMSEPSRSTHAGELYRFQASWWQKLPARALIAVMVIAAIGVGVTLFGAKGRPGSTAIGVVVEAMIIVAAFFLGRAIESRVVITERGLKIRNHIRSYTLSWNEIDGYEGSGHHRLRLASGRRIRLYGLAEGPLGASARAAREADCLNAEIERHKQALRTTTVAQAASDSG